MHRKCDFMRLANAWPNWNFALIYIKLMGSSTLSRHIPIDSPENIECNVNSALFWGREVAKNHRLLCVSPSVCLCVCVILRIDVDSSQCNNKDGDIRMDKLLMSPHKIKSIVILFCFVSNISDWVCLIYWLATALLSEYLFRIFFFFLLWFCMSVANARSHRYIESERRWTNHRIYSVCVYITLLWHSQSNGTFELNGIVSLHCKSILNINKKYRSVS